MPHWIKVKDLPFVSINLYEYINLVYLQTSVYVDTACRMRGLLVPMATSTVPRKVSTLAWHHNPPLEMTQSQNRRYCPKKVPLMTRMILGGSRWISWGKPEKTGGCWRAILELSPLKVMVSNTEVLKRGSMVKGHHWVVAGRPRYSRYMMGQVSIMTSWDWLAFGITGPLWGESTDDRWIPITKGQWCGA